MQEEIHERGEYLEDKIIREFGKHFIRGETHVQFSISKTGTLR